MVGTMKTRSFVFFIVCVVFQVTILLVGHDHCIVFAFEVTEVTDLGHAKHALVDVVTCVFELDVDFVVGEDAHAVNLVAVDVFSGIGETAVFGDHVGGRVEATIMSEDRALW